MERYHVLLIGIDAYDGDNASLTGCVNDIDAIQRILVDRVRIKKEWVTRLAAPRTGTTHEHDVESKLPTLANMRAALRQLGSEDTVAPGDRVFIYYSGHGTQLRVEGPDGRAFTREALVPKDHVRMLRRQYLFDWEINGLLMAIAERSRSVTMILDCCCAAGATRAALNGGGSSGRRARVRFLPSPEPYILDKGDLEAARHQSSDRRGRGITTGVVSTVKTCQVVAACLEDERAREVEDIGGRSHGELTRAIVGSLGTLRDSELARLTWGRIWPSVFASVVAANRNQHPRIFGSYAREVFAGPPRDGDAGYWVERDGNEYRVSAGSLCGVSAGARIAVYGDEPAQFPPLGSAADISACKGVLRVAEVTRATARAIATGVELPAVGRGRLIAAGEATRLAVALRPQDAGLARALDGSPLLAVTREAEAEVVLVRRSDGGWAVTDDVFGAGDAADEPTLLVIPADRLAAMVRVVEHYYAYSAPLRLARRCQDLPHALRLELRDGKGAGSIAVAEAQDPARWPELPRGRLASYECHEGDKVVIVVHNDSEQEIKVTVVVCQDSGEVEILSESVVGRNAAHIVWSGHQTKEPFTMALSGDRKLGVDRIVAIGTTNREASLRHLEVLESFAKVLVPTRGEKVGSGAWRSAGPPQLWTATVITSRLTNSS